jgi:hypothetical protein
MRTSPETGRSGRDPRNTEHRCEGRAQGMRDRAPERLVGGPPALTSGRQNRRCLEIAHLLEGS